MAGKTYIKTGTNTWSRVKKIYLKTGGITWQAVRKAYIKTGATTWKKIYDTTSNRPFIGNDIPKIRLNTFRTDSTAGSLIPGTVNDPVNPVVEAPRVQQMGPPTTTPTVGWPSGTIGNHLWGYDGTWTSGNGSTITFIYQWLYNMTGNSNDNVFDPQFYVSDTSSSINTSSTGRADMLTNSSGYLGYDDGDYFDKNFITFRVGASNSAGGPVFAESVPVYIVRQRPSGTINMINTSVDVPETLSATITYSDQWYNKPDLYDSTIEWFAIDAVGDALTASNRVWTQDLYTVSVTGTTTKTGTVTYDATLPDKIYAVRLTLNNSNTQPAVISVSGFTPSLPFTTEDYSTPGSPLEVTTLDILDYYGNEGTDNRGYIPVGGLFKINSIITGVDGSATYRIRYRMYNIQNGSYYGMDGTNYGANGGSSAWTTRTGSNSSFGFGGTLINEVSVSGTTATLNHRDVISSSSFGSTTYTPTGGTSTDRWMIEIEVSALKNSIRKYYLDFVGGVSYYVSRPAANLLLTASPDPATVNQNVTLSGSIGALGGGLSYPRQYKVTFGDGNDSGWLPFGEWSYGTSNPTFQITKQYAAAGEYYPYFQTIPDYSTGSTSLIVGEALSAPTITSVSAGNVGGPVTVNYQGGSGAARQFYWYSSNVAPNYEVTPDASGTSTTSLTDNTGPTGTGTYYAYVRSVSTAGTTAVGPSAVASAWSAGYPFTMIPPSYNVNWLGNGGSSGNEGIPWSFTAGGSVTVPSATRIGYDFVRWTDTPSGDYTYTTTNVGGTWSPPAQNITMYARWQARVCTIPNVIGMTEIAASNAVNAAGFLYEFTDYQTTYDSSLDGRVAAISPAVGTQPGCGTNITLTIYNYVNVLTAPSIYNVIAGAPNAAVSVYFTGGSGPYYQMWWTTGIGGTSYDASGGSSPLTDSSGPSSAGNWNMYVRSVSSPSNTGLGPSATISDWSPAWVFTVSNPVTCGNCADYGSATYTGQSTGCAGNYYTVYNNYSIGQRKTCTDGSYEYCSNRAYSTVSSSTQIDGQCGYTAPAPCVCNYTDYGSYHFSPQSCPTGTQRTGSLSGFTSGPNCPNVYKTAKYNCKYYDAYNSASVNYYQCYYEGECAALQNPDGTRTTCYV